MNYICLNGKRIELSESQIEEIRMSFELDEKVKLGSLEKGDDFRLGSYEFFVYGHTDEGVVVVLKDLLHDSEEFGENNNYDGSQVDDICNKFYLDLKDIVGEDNIVEYELDLTTDDGLKDYGVVKRKMSLITAQMYRKEVELFDKYKIGKWWWTATPYSTPTHNNTDWVKCVSPVGGLNRNDYGSNDGVRPFCILKSNIFVSK